MLKVKYFNLTQVITKIKRRKTPFYRAIYGFALSAKRIRMPNAVLPFYKIIRILRDLLIISGRRFVTFIYYEPIFRSRCKKVGTGLIYVKLRQGFPYFSGDLHLFIGKNVTVHSRASFSAASVFDYPSLHVGDGTYLGPGLSIGVAKDIRIGACCFISSNVNISDNDGHPLDPIKRLQGKPVPKEHVSPVKIGDYVWIGEGSSILKGVTIGKGAVIGTRSVVVKDIRPFTIVAGNPAKTVGKIEDTGKMES